MDWTGYPSSPDSVSSSFTDDDEYYHPTVVIDNGTKNMRVGFAGRALPAHIFKTTVVRLSNEDRNKRNFGYFRRCDAENAISDDVISVIDAFVPHKRGCVYKSEQAEEFEDRYKHYPIEQGLIQNWDDMETIWDYSFSDKLGIKSEEFNVFVTERALNPKENREKMVEILFEKFNVARFYVANKNNMIAYAHGYNGCMTVDIGYDTTVIGPRCEGSLCVPAVSIQEYGGKDVNDYLSTLINKQSECGNLSMDIVREIRKSFYLRREFKKNSNAIPYLLPDGNTVKLNDSKLLQCVNGLINPKFFGKNENVKGLGEAIVDSMNVVKEFGCSDNVMYKEIIIGGATSQIGNIGRKLIRSINKIKPVECKVHITGQSQHASWIGASIQSSVSSLQWITKEEYNKNGASIVHQKCF